jgi:SAM-dependent methyltransferase
MTMSLSKRREHRNRFVEPKSELDITLLPGLNQQFEYLADNYDLTGKKVLIVGTATVRLCSSFLHKEVKSLDIIIDNEEIIMVERMRLPKADNLRIRYMEFSNTDFRDNSFDLIYSQGAVSVHEHNKILAEMHRILKIDGACFIGEIFYTKADIPISIRDGWTAAGLAPMSYGPLSMAISQNGFSIADTTDLSDTLETLYNEYRIILGRESNALDDAERLQFKKDITRMQHESDLYLKLGGKKCSGYMVFHLRKNDAATA